MQKTKKKKRLSEVRNAWISPDGEIHIVEEDYAHRVFAERNLNATEQMLEILGWVKISQKTTAYCNSRHGFTSKQIDTLFDFIVANNFKSDTLFDNNYFLNFIKDKE